VSVRLTNIINFERSVFIMFLCQLAVVCIVFVWQLNKLFFDCQCQPLVLKFHCVVAEFSC